MPLSHIRLPLAAALLCLAACSPESGKMQAEGVAADSAAPHVQQHPQPADEGGVPPAQQASPPVPPTAQVPARFQGYWSQNCDIDYAESRLLIEADRIHFYESGGAIRAAVVRGEEIALIVDMAGEGEEWLGIMKFQLENNGQAIVDTSDDYQDEKERFVRSKCPNPPAADDV